MLSTLLLSFGLPLLLGGDEIGRTQGGNNNAYCQDNEISWFDWESADNGLRGYVKRLLALRREHPVFRRKRFLTGAEAAELGWFSCAGEPVTEEQWADPTMHAIAVYLDGADAPDDADDGTPLLDDDFLILVNAFWEQVTFTIPPVRWPRKRGSLSWTATTPRRRGRASGTPATWWLPVRARCRS